MGGWWAIIAAGQASNGRDGLKDSVERDGLITYWRVGFNIIFCPIGACPVCRTGSLAPLWTLRKPLT